MGQPILDAGHVWLARMRWLQGQVGVVQRYGLLIRLLATAWSALPAAG